MRLSHYTREPLTRVRSVEQPGKVKGWAFQPKPNGLWVSVDGEDDWPSWCRSSHFALDTFALRYRVELVPGANVLTLGTAEQLDVFTDQWRADLEEYQKYNEVLRDMHIDWPRLATVYQGVIIAPYVWTRRLQLLWYYGWDCASGCIWDAAAIARVVPQP